MNTAATGLAGIALRGRCPRCGRGALFEGLLTVRDRCAVCDLDLRACDTGDGAAFAVMLVLGAILVVLAFWVEFHFNPPLWVHVLLWPAIAFPAAIWMLRVLKAALVAQQFRFRSTELDQ